MERLSAFRINQAGYAAGLPVYAAVLAKEPTVLKNAAGETVRRPACTPQADAASGDEAAVADMGILEEGTYLLESGEERRALTVRPQAWGAVTNALIKGLYYQRCGCALKPEHAGVYAHPACHTETATDWEYRSVRRRVAGGCRSE